MSEKPEEAKAVGDAASKWKLLSFLLAGVLIPIVASILPWVVENWIPKNNLVYSYVGPIQGGDAVAFELRVENAGTEVQSNVEIWVPLQVTNSWIDLPNADEGSVDGADAQPFVLDANVEPSKQFMDNRHHVLVYERLRPSEELELRFFAVGDIFPIFDSDLDRIRIVSDTARAERDMPSEELAFLSQVGAILLVVLVVFLLGFSIYYEKFVPVEKKRDALRKQLEQLGG